jgi:hypothetical protein
MPPKIKCVKCGKLEYKENMTEFDAGDCSDEYMCDECLRNKPVMEDPNHFWQVTESKLGVHDAITTPCPDINGALEDYDGLADKEGRHLYLSEYKRLEDGTCEWIRDFVHQT